MGKLKDKIIVDGYNPLNIINIILSVVSGCIFGIYAYSLTEEAYTYKMGDLIFLLLAILCFLLLLFRNRNLKSTPKMIIFSVASLALGVLVAIALMAYVYFFVFK